MKITKKTLCAVRAILYIGRETEKNKDKYISIKEIADCQRLSVSYLEQILNKLKKNKIIFAKRGPHGGYRLNKAPEKITLNEIFNIFESKYKILNCAIPSDKCTGLCEASADVWDDLNNVIESYLKSKNIREYL